MVVSIDELACLDYLIWVRSGSAASDRLDLSQPTISRRVQRVAKVFNVKLSKPDGEWEVLGDTTILNLERKVHQVYRWSHDLPLRIEAQYYSGYLFCERISNAWVKGSFYYLEIHTPLRYLRDGVIDAWIGCYPDVPEDDDPDLKFFHLTRLPVRVVVPATYPLTELGDAVTLNDVKDYPSLALPDNAFPKVESILRELGLSNTPLQMKRYKEDWEGRVRDHLAVAVATSVTFTFFESHYVFLPIQLPLEVGDTLVVRREFANQPRLHNLLECLQKNAVELQRRFSDVSLCF